MSGASKRSLEDRLDEDSDYEWGWGEVVKCKYPRKETVDVGWAGPSSSGQAQNQQQQQPQQQQPSAWQQSRSYSSTFPEGRHEGKDKDREKENEWEVKAAETKEEEVKTEIKAEPKESKPDKDHYLTKGEKEPYIDGKDVSRDHRRQYQQLENEGFKGTVEEDGDFCETKEAVGENKVMDWKTEREEKKRKEESVNCSGERKEKERNREKDSIHSVKEVEVKEENVETDGKMSRRETDEKEKKKDKEKQGDNERQEKRTRHPTQDKEGADDGNIDGEGAPERERGDSFYGGIQQRRRMLRPRGHSQAGPREARSRFRPRDSEGFQGRSDPSAVVYKVGECMQEIIKLWKEFESAQALKNCENSSTAYPTLEIRIPAEHVTTANHQVRGSQLWGTDIYTDDSDLVAVLMHTGYYRPTAALPPPAIHELRATIRVLPPQDSYTSTLRNSVRSRAWGAASGCSYKVERCRIMKKGGGSIELEPCLMRISAVAPTLAPVAMERTMTTRAAASNAYRQQRFVREVTIQYNLCNEPWMKYSISIVADRGLKRSQFTSARLRKGEVLYVETHWNRYELSYDGERATCNGSFGATTATSIPSQTANSSVPCQTANSSERSDKPVGNEMEKHPGGSSHIGDKSQGRHVHDGEKAHIVGENSDRYKWALCKQPLPQKVMQSIGVPLPPEHVKVLEENLDWEEVLWSQTGVWVRGKEYCLTRAHFLSSS